MDRRIHAFGMVLECLLLAISGLFRTVPGTTALPPTADSKVEHCIGSRKQTSEVRFPLKSGPMVGLSLESGVDPQETFGSMRSKAPVS